MTTAILFILQNKSVLQTRFFAHILQYMRSFSSSSSLCCISKYFEYITINKITNLHKVLSALLILSIITGCGFHLRGSFSLPKYLQSIYITPDDPYEPLQKNLRRALQQNNIQQVTEINDKTAILELTNPDFSETILAFNSNGQAQRFKLVINFQYSLHYANKVLRPFTNIQCSRDFTLTPNQLLSSDNERILIKDELLREAIGLLLQQLSTIPAPT